jgi:hypothetical protein
VEYSDAVETLKATEPELAAEIAGFRGLGTVMNWMTARGILLKDVEIVQQDECNLDFVVPLNPDGRCLVFGTT